jgi:uncharacterized membrane protein
MARVEKSIEVHVPVTTAYNQWTQFEEFPRFMDGVKSVQQVDDRHLRWEAKVGGREKTWDAEIQEQVPDQRIIWRATDGTENAGMVSFIPTAADATKVTLQMSYDPEGFIENAGNALGIMGHRVQGDLERFRDFIEERGAETGAYRQALRNDNVLGGFTRGTG